MTYADLVYVPEVGFMPARALGTRANVVVERDGRTFSGAVAPDRDGIRVIFTVSEIEADVPSGEMACPVPIKAAARVVDDRGREVAARARWFTGPMLRSAGPERATLQWTLILEAPEPDARELALSFDGPAGEWDVGLPLEPIVTTGTPARTFESIDTRHGITLAARAVATTADRTIVELEAFLDPPSSETGPARRYVAGLGPCLHSGRLCGDQIVLRDDMGGRQLETGRPSPEPTGGKQREAVSFAAVPADARSGVVEIEAMWVQEGHANKIALPIPGEYDITAAGCEAHAVVTREPGTYTNGAVKVEVFPKGTDADRQLAFMQGVDVAGGSQMGMQISHSVGKSPVVTVPDPTGRTPEVMLSGPVVQIRGPWKVRVPLDAG